VVHLHERGLDTGGTPAQNDLLSTCDVVWWVHTTLTVLRTELDRAARTIEAIFIDIHRDVSGLLLQKWKSSLTPVCTSVPRRQAQRLPRRV
jgi:hypothetical protein